MALGYFTLILFEIFSDIEKLHNVFIMIQYNVFFPEALEGYSSWREGLQSND